MSTRSDLTKQIATYESEVGNADALGRLMVNKDFKEVFLEGYCKAHALSLIKDLSNYSTDTSDYRNIVEDLDAISRFQTYLNETTIKGQLAKADLVLAKSIPDSELN